VVDIEMGGGKSAGLAGLFVEVQSEGPELPPTLGLQVVLTVVVSGALLMRKRSRRSLLCSANTSVPVAYAGNVT